MVCVIPYSHACSFQVIFPQSLSVFDWLNYNPLGNHNHSHNSMLNECGMKEGGTIECEINFCETTFNYQT